MRTIKGNIVKSFLFVCSGLAIATIAFASTRVFGPPSAPGRPEAVDIWADRCTLNYRAPLSDGGSPITGFLIEGRNIANGRWVPKGISKYLTHTLVGFVENSTHEFRVSAQNAAGLGKPSGVSNPVIFRDPYK